MIQPRVKYVLIDYPFDLGQLTQYLAENLVLFD